MCLHHFIEQMFHKIFFLKVLFEFCQRELIFLCVTRKTAPALLITFRHICMTYNGIQGCHQFHLHFTPVIIESKNVCFVKSKNVICLLLYVDTLYSIKIFQNRESRNFRNFYTWNNVKIHSNVKFSLKISQCQLRFKIFAVLLLRLYFLQLHINYFSSTRFNIAGQSFTW